MFENVTCGFMLGVNCPQSYVDKVPQNQHSFLASSKILSLNPELLRHKESKSPHNPKM